MGFADFNKLVESVEHFINDLAQTFREKHWLRLLSLLGVVSGLLLNPPSVEYGLKLLNVSRPHWYSYPTWGIITAAFFVAAFLVALLTKKRQESETTASAISIIKGLLPYTNTKEDAAWFAKLQRASILQDCLRICLAKGSSFVILTGESGTGKTSFLQAGLSPSIDEQGRRAVYVKLTDKPPLDSIHQSLNSESENSIANDEQSLLSLLRQAARNDSRAVVLILDQFEQFFTNHKSKISRKSFVQQMTEWYEHAGSLPITILISIRDDFADRMTEFQKEMEYTLTAHNKLRLENFEPQEATQVISVIGREAKIELDEDFVRDLTKHELADREEGTVSPVDIQILSWMLDAQKSSEERAFNRKAFQKLGGVEGLLERFLNRQLKTRETDARRQATIKVMLALTDQNVRAGALSVNALKKKLSGVISSEEVEEAVSWLARGDVRLLTPIEEKKGTLYELAHERMILPLHRLAFKEITKAQRAQQTLDRRVNEWIGNNRARRYLLTLKEWRLIKGNWALIALGSQKEQKEEFVSLSKGRFVLRALIVAAVSLLGFGGYAIYKWNERRPETQIYNAQKRIVELLNANRDVKSAQYAALLLSVLESEKDQELFQKLWQQINGLDSSAQVHVLTGLAEAYVKLSKPDEAVKTLDKVQQLVDKLDPVAQASVLTGVAEAYVKLSKPDEAAKTLDKVQHLVAKLDPAKLNVDNQSNILTRLAEAYGKLSKPDETVKGLDEVQQLVGKFSGYAQIRVLTASADAYGKLSKPDEGVKGLDRVQQLVGKLGPDAQARVLLAVAEAYGKLSKPDEAVKTLDKVQQLASKFDPGPQSNVLTEVADAYGKLSKPDEAVKTLDKVQQLVANLDRGAKAYVFQSLAEKYGNLSNVDEAVKGLDKVQQLIVNLDDPFFQALVLTRVAEAYGTLSDPDEAVKGLGKLQQLAVEFDSSYQASVLTAVAKAYGNLSNADKAVKGLDKVQQLASKLHASYQASVLTAVAKSYNELSRNDESLKTLAQAEQAANVTSSAKKSSALVEIATIYAKLHRWREAIGAAQSIGYEVDAISAMSRILITWKDAENSTKNMDALERLFQASGVTDSFQP
jgi:glutamate mutase epsilon subunit